MKKIIIVEDNQAFINLFQRVIRGKFPQCTILIYKSAEEASKSIKFDNSDFNILLLDGNLGHGGSGEAVLVHLTKVQIGRTIVCSGDDVFITKAKVAGVQVFLDKGFGGVGASQINGYIAKTLEKV